MDEESQDRWSSLGAPVRWGRGLWRFECDHAQPRVDSNSRPGADPDAHAEPG